jgi:hypothetical protein
MFSSTPITACGIISHAASTPEGNLSDQRAFQHILHAAHTGGTAGGASVPREVQGVLIEAYSYPWRYRGNTFESGPAERTKDKPVGEKGKGAGGIRKEQLPGYCCEDRW